MNAGLSSLTALKALVLPEGLRAATAYDVALTALGLGVAAQMERHCNRVFERSAAATYTVSAGLSTIGVNRYPIASITSLEMLPAGATAWETLTGQINNFYEASGLVEFAGIIGTYQDKLKLTFAGGWWWDTTEDSSGTLPALATAVPADVKHAWVLQMNEVIRRTDLLRSGSAKNTNEPEVIKALTVLDLIPIVKTTLQPHRRFNV